MFFNAPLTKLLSLIVGSPKELGKFYRELWRADHADALEHYYQVPKASFIGFPSPPPIGFPSSPFALSRAVVIDVYDILQSKEDKATLPIYYEARLAKIDLNPEKRPKIDPNFEEGAGRTVIGRRGGRHEGKFAPEMGATESDGRTDKRIALVAEGLVKYWEARYSAKLGNATGRSETAAAGDENHATLWSHGCCCQ